MGLGIFEETLREELLEGLRERFPHLEDEQLAPWVESSMVRIAGGLVERYLLLTEDEHWATIKNITPPIAPRARNGTAKGEVA